MSGLSETERNALTFAWPWPKEAATTAYGFRDVEKAVERIIADRLDAHDRLVAALRELADEWTQVRPPLRAEACRESIHRLLAEHEEASDG